MRSRETIQKLQALTGNGGFIDGFFSKAKDSEEYDLVDPATENVTGTMAVSDLGEVDKAIAAARQAFDHGPWPTLSPLQRAEYLSKLLHSLEKHIPLLKDVWTAEVGGPQLLANLTIPMASGIWNYYINLAKEFSWNDRRQGSIGDIEVVSQPVGVCAIITPWNAPLVILSFKLAAALIAGCTVVIKPAPETPFEALLIAKLAKEAGIPDGVINVVTASMEGSLHLVEHQDIDKVSFTGSTAAGKNIAKTCANRMARVSLELGGKSAAILLDDVDLQKAFPAFLPWTMPFSGQACLAQTRILVPENRLDEVTGAICHAMSGLNIGDPWNPETQFGPVVNLRQKNNVLTHIEHAKEDGAQLAFGGGAIEEFERGYWVQPTVFTQVDRSMRLAQEEVFGPVLAIMPYEDEQDAIEIANGTAYGLHGSVFSSNEERAIEIARQIRTGSIGVNCFGHDPVAPFGGFKESGVGREGGPEGLRAFLEAKAIYLQGSKN